MIVYGLRVYTISISSALNWFAQPHSFSYIAVVIVSVGFNKITRRVQINFSSSHKLARVVVRKIYRVLRRNYLAGCHIGKANLFKCRDTLPLIVVGIGSGSRNIAGKV